MIAIHTIILSILISNVIFIFIIFIINVDLLLLPLHSSYYLIVRKLLIFLMLMQYKALELGLKPKAYIRGWTYVGVDPFEELLLGPTFATNKVLRSLNLTLADIGVIEFHEAFAGTICFVYR